MSSSKHHSTIVISFLDLIQQKKFSSFVHILFSFDFSSDNEFSFKIEFVLFAYVLRLVDKFQSIMADRDNPSVPVTTLAGLASVSDCKWIRLLIFFSEYFHSIISVIFQCWVKFRSRRSQHQQINHYCFIRVSVKKRKISCAWKMTP